MSQFVSGFAAVIGRPNVGKSSLINTMVGEKVAIVSDKPQTTRNRIMGVVNGAGYQLVVLDTPGIQKPKNKLGRYMEGAVRHSLTDIEAALVVVDGAKGLGSRDEEALFRATHCGVPVIAALNKIDLAQPEQIRSLSARLAAYPCASSRCCRPARLIFRPTLLRICRNRSFAAKSSVKSSCTI